MSKSDCMMVRPDTAPASPRIRAGTRPSQPTRTSSNGKTKTTDPLTLACQKKKPGYVNRPRPASSTWMRTAAPTSQVPPTKARRAISLISSPSNGPLPWRREEHVQADCQNKGQERDRRHRVENGRGDEARGGPGERQPGDHQTQRAKQPATLECHDEREESDGGEQRDVGQVLDHGQAVGRLS